MAWETFYGTRGVGTGDVTPTLPPGWQADDFALLIVESSGGQPATAPAGWNTVAIVDGTVATPSCLSVFSRRFTGSETAPTVLDTGDHTYAIIYTIRGATTSGSPIRVSATASEVTAQTRINFPALAGVQKNDLIFAINGNGIDYNGSRLVEPFGVDDRNASFLIADGGSTNSGDGGGYARVTAISEIDGTIDGVYATLATAAGQNNLVLAIIPDGSTGDLRVDKGWLGFVVDAAPFTDVAVAKGWLGFVVDTEGAPPPPGPSFRTWWSYVN